MRVERSIRSDRITDWSVAIYNDACRWSDKCNPLRPRCNFGTLVIGQSVHLLPPYIVVRWHARIASAHGNETLRVVRAVEDMLAKIIEASAAFAL